MMLGVPKTGKRIRRLLVMTVVATKAIANASTTADHSTTISNRTMTVVVSSGSNAPRLLWASGSPDFRFVNTAEETLPASIEIGSQTLPLHWTRKPELDRRAKREVVFVYESDRPHLRLSWEWQMRADFGPAEHRITVENLGTDEVWLPMIDSLRLNLPCPQQVNLRHLYVDKGADTPTAIGTHIEEVPTGYHWTGYSSTYGFPQKGEAREVIPAEFVFNSAKGHAAWLAGIEFSGRTRISFERTADSLKTVLGLNPDPGPFRTRLAPGTKFETPTAFFGIFSGEADGAANLLHGWVRTVLGNPATWNDSHYPFTVNNSWGGGMQINEDLALRMMADANQLGLEMFHVDAGWFRGVGDWYPNLQKFPHGLAYLADEAHKRGMRFGLWVDWTQAALDTQPGALNVRDPKVRDWMVTDLPPTWKPEDFKGQTVDLGAPGAHDYFEKEVNRIITDNHLDMLEHDGYLVAQGCVRDDHPHAPPNRSTMKIVHDWGSYFVVADNSTDVSYHAVRAYYDIYAKMRQAHPGLIFEICDDGGRMVDFGSAAHGDYFSITDTYDPLSNRRAFYDTSYMLPPAMLESYVEKWPVPRPENFLYMLRSGMMGWVTIMINTTTWTPEQHEAARQAIALYKEKLRPLIRDAQLYHVSARPDGVHWDGMEYWDPVRKHGVLYAFRGSVADENNHTFVLTGLDAASHYRLHFQDGSSRDREATGKQLMNEGLEVKLEHPLSSELVFVEQAP